ncbi:hypothetical protein C7B80_25060 [Cyanosarcina cf. burmensis CCALA 770]|nr:hypothetical protein C7B80_25060 [Cyanosarcina cf. burmensis CCALA 770]
MYGLDFCTLASVAISSLLLPVPVALAKEPVSSNNFIPTQTYTNEQQLVSVPDWSNITFSSLPPTEEAGKIDLPPELAKALGYDLNRSWQAGTTVDRILMLGDVQEAFGLNAFNLKDTSNLAGLAIQNLNLNDLGLLHWQTPKSLLKAIPQLGDLPIEQIAPLKDLWQLSGNLGSGTVAQLVRQNPIFGNLPLGKLDLSRYSLRSIPGLSQIPFSEFKDWQQAIISQIPGLSAIPFGRFPTPLALSGIFVARTDWVWSEAESGDPSVPPQLYISGTVNRKGKTVPVPCQAGKPCAHIELGDLLGSRGSYHGKRWVSGRSQKVKGGFGILKVVNGGWEPTGIAVYPKVPFKVVLTDVNESEGTANFALYFHACRSIPFIGKSCTPYFIGPIPWLTTKEKGLVIVAATSKPNVNISSKYRERIAQLEEPQSRQQDSNSSSAAPIDSSSNTVGTANQRITSAINKLGRFGSNVSGTDGGKNACMWAVNRVLKQAGYAPLGNDTLAVRVGQADLENGRGEKIDLASSQPGDIVVVDAGGSRQHIGFCLNPGCTQTLSNSSSRATFSFYGNSNFSYPGSPYNGSIPQVYRLRK